ncbi:MAG TPA: hypothetical protein DD459_04975, partial [Halieaceae bacterium]|nr:hypothetical protein [Halieaceae bacterium]
MRAAPTRCRPASTLTDKADTRYGFPTYSADRRHRATFVHAADRVGRVQGCQNHCSAADCQP